MSNILKIKMKFQSTILAVLTLTCFQTECSLNVINPKIDHKTQSYKFSPLNRKSKANTVVGSVRAIDVNKIVTYSMIDVIVDGTDTPSKNAWESKAKDTSNDDCSEEILKSYPKPRNYFCINHETGKIFTTKYFAEEEPETGTFYKFQIEYISTDRITGIKMSIIERPPLSVLIFSNCDALKNIYSTMESHTSCNQDESVIVGISNSNAPRSQLTISFDKVSIDQAYLTSLRIDFSKGSGQLNYGDVVIFKISANNFNTNASLIYLSSKSVHIAYVKSPPRLMKGEIFTIFAERITNATTTVSANTTSINSQHINISPAMFGIIFMKKRDYCPSSSNCISLAGQYYDTLLNNEKECINIDESNFHAMYGYCTDNLAPQFTNKTAELNWDAIQYSQAPVQILTNYISNIQRENVVIRIVGIVSNQHSPDVKFDELTAHQLCTTKTLANVSTPRAFFCINDQNGALFTTEAFAGSTYSDQDFNIEVEVSVLNFPPKVTTGNITVSMQSVCRSTTSLFRMLLDANCGEDSATFSAVFKTEPNKGQSSVYNVNIDFLTETPIQQQIYFAGIRLKQPMQRLTPEQVGSFIEFYLKEDRKTINAKYFYIGSYISFTEPLQYAADKIYTFSAKRFDKLNSTPMDYSFDLSQFEVVFVVQKDYCSARTDCADFYLAYQHEYTATKSVTERNCADPNVQGYKIMYGYCQDNDAPRIRKTSYILNVNRAFVKAEVIPATAQIYVTDENPLNFELLEVTSNGNETDQTDSSIDISTPNECTPTYANAPMRYFCIGKNTGKIYTTSAINGKVQINSRFSLKVRVSDTTVFPIRILDITLSLSADDKCSPASLTYSNLSNCVRYSLTKPSTKSDQNSYVFNSPKNFQVIIAVQFRLDDMIISKDASKISANYEVELTNRTVLPPQTTSPKNLMDSLEEYSSVELNIPNNKMIQYIYIKFIQHYKNESTNFVLITNFNSATLLYIENFQCEISCKTLYNTWIEQALLKNVSCQHDSLLYRRNFEVCTEKPVFPSPPTLSSSYLRTGDNVTISNCIYHSPYQIKVSEWRKDNNVIKTATNTPQRRKRRNILDDYPNLPGYLIEDLFIQNLKMVNQGSYQCSVQEGNTRTSSVDVYLRLQDVATTTVEVVLANVDWKDDFGNKLSTEYIELQANVQNKMEEKVAEGDGDNVLVKVLSASWFRDLTRVMMDVHYAGNVEVRTRYCQKITSSYIEQGFGDYTVQSATIMHKNCCIAERQGEINFKGLYNFPATIVGQQTSHNCTYGNNGPFQSISRQCYLNPNSDPIWTPFNVSICQPKTQTTKLLIYLFEVSGKDNAVTLSRNLSVIVQQGTLTNQVDVELVANLIGDIVSKDAASENVTLNILNTIDGILDTEESLLVEANQNKNTSSKILQQLDYLAAAQPANTTGKILETKNVGMAVIKPTPQKNIFISSKAGNSSETIQMKISENGQESNGDATILLPASVVGGSKLVYSYVFKKTSLFQSNGNLTIQSNIMSATVVNKTVANLTSNKIEITFDANEVANYTNMENVCKFFVETLQDTSNPWSREGCTTIRDPVSKKVKCVCDHLTNFAILLDVDQSGSNPLALQIITWIGCGISLAGLFITIITYSIFGKLRKKLPPKILISLSVSLSALLIIFLAGVERTSPRVGCQIVSGLLQYFILSTFCWMAVEGLNLYRNFVKVFSGGSSNTKFFIKASVFSWGLPAAITIATGAVKPDNLGPALPEHPQFCVVRGGPFFFAVLAPVVLVLIGNMIVLVLVLRGIKDGSQLVKDSKAEKNKKLTQARIAFACSVLLGLTWVFAILAIGEVRDFFQWMFCIFNSLQGFFIFVFYTLRSAEARREWKALLGISTLERTSTSSRWHSKYISVYRLTHIGSVIKSRSGKEKEKESVKGSTKGSTKDNKSEKSK